MGKLIIVDNDERDAVELGDLVAGDLFQDLEDGDDLCMVIQSNDSNTSKVAVVSLRDEPGTYWECLCKTRKVRPVSGKLILI
jgi:hypothetical protein